MLSITFSAAEHSSRPKHSYRLYSSFVRLFETILKTFHLSFATFCLLVSLIKLREIASTSVFQFQAKSLHLSPIRRLFTFCLLIPPHSPPAWFIKRSAKTLSDNVSGLLSLYVFMWKGHSWIVYVYCSRSPCSPHIKCVTAVLLFLPLQNYRWESMPQFTVSYICW